MGREGGKRERERFYRTAGFPASLEKLGERPKPGLLSGGSAEGAVGLSPLKEACLPSLPCSLW